MLYEFTGFFKRRIIAALGIPAAFERFEMASSLLKKVRIRAARCEIQLLELRAECTNVDDQRRLDVCIAAMREASSRMDAALLDIVPAPAAPTMSPPLPAAVAGHQMPPARLPDSPVPETVRAAAPVYGPSTGVYEAKAPGMKGAAAQIIEDDRDVMPMANYHADDDEKADEILRGIRGGAYQNDAAKRLALRPQWGFWTGSEKLVAIDELARELEANDDTDYFPASNDAAAPAPAVDAPQDPDNVTF